MLQEYALKKLLDAGVSLATQHARDLSGKLTTSPADLENAISDHVSNVLTWAGQISFGDMVGAKSTIRSYIPLSISVMPRRRRLEDEGPIRAIDLDQALSGKVSQHVVLLGQPGAGKTTSMKYLCYKVASDPSFQPHRFAFPLLIRLRELASPTDADEAIGIVLNHIQALLGITVAFPDRELSSEDRKKRASVTIRALTSLLNTLQPLIILDGLDEIPTRKARDLVIEDFRSLAAKLDRATIVLTSRTGEYAYHIEHAAEYEILPLSLNQIDAFAAAWLGEAVGKDLMAAIERSPFGDTAIRPLTIAHLCAIYERTGRIPEKPKTVYKKVVNLLLEEWDEQRSVRRLTRFENFEIDRKAEFLASLAYALSSRKSRAVFSNRDLVRAYREMCDDFGLPAREALKVVAELESHTGIFVQAGYSSFEFCHKSIQEYLTAEYIVRLPSVPDKVSQLRWHPNELAIAVAISSSPSDYFAELVGVRFRKVGLDFEFFRIFVNRLLLEKPDFNSTSVIGWSLLDLYSQYLSTVMNAEQMSLFLMDVLADEFRELGQLIRARISLAQLLSVYDLVETTDELRGFQIVRMLRRQTIGSRETQSKFPRIDLPKQIYVREALLAE